MKNKNNSSPTHEYRVSISHLVLHAHTSLYLLSQKRGLIISLIQPMFLSYPFTHNWCSQTQQEKKHVLSPSSVAKRDCIHAVVISVTADVWLMSGSVWADAVVHLCEQYVDLRTTPVSWLPSTPRCQADQLAGECRDWMSRSTRLNVRTRRENIIDFCKNRSLFDHKYYGPFGACFCECVCVHTSALNKRIIVLSTTESALNLFYCLYDVTTNHIAPLKRVYYNKGNPTSMALTQNPWNASLNDCFQH